MDRNIDYKNIMVYVEISDEKPVNVGLEMMTPARTIADAKGGKVIALIVDKNSSDAAEIVAESGADEIILVEAPAYNGDIYTEILENLVSKYEPAVLMIGGNQYGKEIAPRLAARFNTGCITDVIGVSVEDDGKIVWTTPMYGGTILNDVIVEESRPQIITVHSGAFKKPLKGDMVKGNILSENALYNEASVKTNIVDTVKEISETINLEEADVVVSGGRGMGSAENFSLVEEMAQLLGGVVGATRPAIEAEWVSRAHQVGQSGKIVSPKLYIACGISGATQHMSGMVGSDYIVAINKDEDAPIFEVANVGIVGNVLEVLPVMIEEIKKIKSSN